MIQAKASRGLCIAIFCLAFEDKVQSLHSDPESKI